MEDVRIEAAAKALARTFDCDFDNASRGERRGFKGDAKTALKAADAVDPLRNQLMVTTDGEFAALPTDARIWGSSHQHPGVAGSGSPYVKLEDGMWWDFDNEYAVGPDDIMRPAILVYAPTTEAP